MLNKLKRVKKCKKKVTEMIKNGESFNYSNDFFKYKGNVPESCLYHNEFKILLLFEII